MGDKGEGGIKKSQKIGDVIYGRPLEIKKLWISVEYKHAKQFLVVTF